MKKAILPVVFFFIIITVVRAQEPTPQPGKSSAGGKTSLTVFGGYVFKDQVSLVDFYGYFNASGMYGGSLEYFVKPSQSIELSYTRVDTHAPLYLYSGVGGQLNEGTDAVGINYILLGSVRYLPTHSPIVKPYGGLGAGVGIVHNKNSGGDITEFAWNAKLGVKLMTGKSLSVKLQTQLMSITQAAGAGIYVGSGGAGLGVSSYSSIYQFGFSGGLVFGF